MKRNLEMPYAVYGTLRTGEGNDRLWRGLATGGEIDTVQGYRLVTNGGFPYALPCGGQSSTIEIVIPIDDSEAQRQMRSRLDMLEGYPSFYDRVIVTTDSGKRCWMYTPVCPSEYERLPAVYGNDWCARVVREDLVTY
jgi:gamma-glutamylcyclotransferase (GGCT)/AIG2-like uncharacterized protein YtfP